MSSASVTAHIKHAITLPKPSDEPFVARDGFRNEKMAFDPAVDAQGGEHIVQILHGIDQSLKLYTCSSPSYEALRSVYNKQISARPLVICRPTSTAQVQAIVQAAVSIKAPVAVRGAGHDHFGRSCVANAVMIDMREMDSLVLSQDRQTVRVGGGTTSRNLVGFLDTHGACTASCTTGTVGWTGWALWGGYGPMSSYTGLGLDNILAAKIVTADGNVIEADGQSELLWGIRGAGGNLGVIVETTVRSYPMPAILGGVIEYDEREIVNILLGLQGLLERGVPDELCMQLELVKAAKGIALNLVFVWPGKDLNEGRQWLEIVRNLAETTVDTVEETTFNALQCMTTSLVAEPVNIASSGITISRFTLETVNALVQSMSHIPDDRCYTIMALINHGKAAQPNPASCFGTRQPHVLFHIKACDKPERMHDASGWVNEVASALQSTGQTMKSSYVSFMDEGERTDESFGDNWEKLQVLKCKVDQDNVFLFAQPKLGC